MRIERIQIRNYRGVRECDVSFQASGNVAVLAGANGSGKTSFMEACRWCLGTDYGLRPVPAYNYEIVVSILGNDGFRYDIRRSLNEHVAVRGDGQVVPVSNEFLNNIGAQHCWYFTSWRDPRLTDGVDIQTSNATTVRIPGTTKEETLDYIKTALVRWDVTTQFNRDESQIRQVQTVFRRLSEARNLFFPQSPGNFVSRSISAVLAANGFVPNMLKPDFRFELYLQRLSDAKLISVNDLSSGELEILCFTGVLILNPLLSIVYIDEPELHLNMQWHSMLIRALQMVAPNVQFIVATHSSEIWNSVYPTQRFLLSEGRCFNV